MSLWWRVEALSAAVFSVLWTKGKASSTFSLRSPVARLRQVRGNTRPVSVQTWPQELKTNPDNNKLFSVSWFSVLLPETFP